MTTDQVKQKLKDKDLTYRKLAKRWRVTSGMVSNFINGDTKSARLEKRLAGVLGVSVDDLRRNDATN